MFLRNQISKEVQQSTVASLLMLETTQNRNQIWKSVYFQNRKLSIMSWKIKFLISINLKNSKIWCNWMFSNCFAKISKFKPTMGCKIVIFQCFRYCSFDKISTSFFILWWYNWYWYIKTTRPHIFNSDKSQKILLFHRMKHLPCCVYIWKIYLRKKSWK